MTFAPGLDARHRHKEAMTMSFGHLLHPSIIVACVLFLPSLATAQPKPERPSTTVPPLQHASVEVTCIECPAPFDTITHKQLLDGLAANPYVAELRRALYIQDSIHQFESKAHFDNCDFNSATAYISSLLDEVGQHVKEATAAEQSGTKADIEPAVKKAFYTLGQVMHAVQDFYAHTNYVELTAPSAKTPDAIKLIEPWTATGRKQIEQMQQKGLISGFVFWSFPQKCPAGTQSHSNLAKDSEHTKSGKKRIAHFQNLSQYRIAVFLARKASISLMLYAFQRWPLLQEVNGDDIAFEVILDRRGI